MSLDQHGPLEHDSLVKAPTPSGDVNRTGPCERCLSGDCSRCAGVACWRCPNPRHLWDGSGR